MPRKGQFQPGNKGGPGRPKKPDELFQLHIRDNRPPPQPDAGCSPLEWLEYDLQRREFEATGSWPHEIFVTRKWFDRIMHRYKEQKMRDAKAMISDAYWALYPQMFSELLRDRYESAVEEQDYPASGVSTFDGPEVSTSAVVAGGGSGGSPKEISVKFRKNVKNVKPR